MRIDLDTKCIEIYADKFMDFYEYDDDYIPYDDNRPRTLREELESFLEDLPNDGKLQEGEEEIIRDILAKGYAETCNGNYYKIEAVEVFTTNPYTWQYHLIIPIEEVDRHNEKVRLEEEKWEREHPKTETANESTPVPVTSQSVTLVDVDDLPF